MAVSIPSRLRLMTFSAMCLFMLAIGLGLAALEETQRFQKQMLAGSIAQRELLEEVLSELAELRNEAFLILEHAPTGSDGHAEIESHSLRQHLAHLEKLQDSIQRNYRTYHEHLSPVLQGNAQHASLAALFSDFFRLSRRLTVKHAIRKLTRQRLNPLRELAAKPVIACGSSYKVYAANTPGRLRRIKQRQSNVCITAKCWCCSLVFSGSLHYF